MKTYANVDKQRGLRLRLFVEKYFDGKTKTHAKTTSGARVIPMHPHLKELLHGLPRRSEFVFSTIKSTKRTNNVLRTLRRDMVNVWKTVRPDIRGADLQAELSLIDVHSLRYTFVTELIAAGSDPKTVQVLAGHRSISTTLNIYAQCRPDVAQSAITKLDFGTIVTQTKPKGTKKPS
jgi:integrase